MKRYHVACVLAVAVSVVLMAMPAFSQDEEVASPAQAPGEAPAMAAASPAPAIKEEAPKSKDLSIYGEVQAVNAAQNSIAVQYYDYDSDEEKTLDITVDKDTKIENVAALKDVNKNDWVDVTYTIAEGKAVAKSVAVEKEEEISTEMPPEPGEAALEEPFEE